ncbi:flavodoxin domain-containing protein [Colwellia echini]|uniref:NADPH--hemoprotein reductase n=1 Tax=Colwellia echini TaxID=1982103 RepID=A0ABY3MT06_9GAMM|nr:flavodoxin domain-containing protein [Colwellia echini]TYK64271.1 hypothetical protein CWS31_016555 [Colwellia echini]
MQSLYSTNVVIIFLSVAWLVLCFVMWRLHRFRCSTPATNGTVLITYASQTGNAQAIANRCAQALDLSESSHVIALNSLTFEHLDSIEKILFVVSTYGNGEAPDNGALFIKKFSKMFAKHNAKQTSADNNNTYHENKVLSHLSYSIIALGDSSYPEFCAFGYQVNQTMLKAGANSLGNVITVDNYEEQITKLADITPDWINIDHEVTLNPEIKSLQYWQLNERVVLNPDCNDEKLLQLNFTSIGPCPHWQAGDLIDIQPQNPVEVVEQWLLENQFNGDTWLTYQGHQQTLTSWLLTRELPKVCLYTQDELVSKLPYLHKRSYSIASITQSGQLELIVRLFESADTKKFGLASGYLSHYCQIGDVVEGQIRNVSAYHNIDHSKSIILIGAGSGLAGLKAQIAERTFFDNHSVVNNKTGPSWLIFGERNDDPQLPLNQQLANLQASSLTKLSCAYSQKNAQETQVDKYVQDIVLREQVTVKQWVADGASIYVCGSLSGMGEGVQQTLIDILGQSSLEKLQQQQRYIRDVY